MLTGEPDVLCSEGLRSSYFLTLITKQCAWYCQILRDLVERRWSIHSLWVTSELMRRYYLKFDLDLRRNWPRWWPRLIKIAMNNRIQVASECCLTNASLCHWGRKMLWGSLINVSYPRYRCWLVMNLLVYHVLALVSTSEAIQSGSHELVNAFCYNNEEFKC